MSYPRINNKRKPGMDLNIQDWSAVGEVEHLASFLRL
jgi:hypothetical protein